jgi:hypothetical protein
MADPSPPRPPRPPSASSFREMRDALRASPHVARLAHDGEAATVGVLVLALGVGLCLGLILPADIEGEPGGGAGGGGVWGAAHADRRTWGSAHLRSRPPLPPPPVPAVS